MVHWKAKIEHKMNGGDEAKLFSPHEDLNRGLRVRMGINLCHEIEAKFDHVHGRYDYYGPDVNLSARVESIAAGGQVLMSSETMRALMEEEDYELIKEDTVSILASHGVSLKGVADKVPIFQILPKSLSLRKFEPLEGAQDDGMDHSAGGDTASMASSIYDEKKSGIARAIDSIFSSFDGDRKAKTTFINKVADHHGISAKLPLLRKIKAIKKALTPVDNGSASGSMSQSVSKRDYVVPFITPHGAGDSAQPNEL